MHLSWTGCCTLLALAGCATGAPPPPPPAPAPVVAQACTEVGAASWYHAGAKARVAPDGLVAAHRTLPLGTSVEVTVLDTGQSVVVRISGRGPFRAGRVIDLSETAARQLGIRRDGISQVRLRVDGPPDQACPLREAKLTVG